MDHGGRRDRLVARLSDLGIDALLSTRLSNVWYLTGFSGSNGQVLVAPAGSVLFTDGRYDEQSSREVGDLRREIYASGFPERFARACRELGLSRVGFEAESVTWAMHRDLAAAAAGAGVELAPTTGEVERLRWVKEPEELERLRAAQAVADAALAGVLDRIGPGVTERELAVLLESRMHAEGADRPSFDTIVAFGPDAAEPHHAPTGRELRLGEVVKMDFGCVVGGYHSDMTRTVAFGPPGAMAEVYEVVRRAQQAGVDAVRAGAVSGEVDRAARSVIEEAGHGEAFSHSLGHGVGLDVHEGPFLRATGTDVLPAGAVVTVEPGVYLPGVGGVRIEDMVEVTGDGAIVLPTTTKELIVL